MYARLSSIMRMKTVLKSDDYVVASHAQDAPAPSTTASSFYARMTPAPMCSACGGRPRKLVGDPMLDFLFVVASVLFFAIATAYVRGCERLR